MLRPYISSLILAAVGFRRDDRPVAPAYAPRRQVRKVVFSILPQESRWGENGQPSATYEVFCVPSNNGFHIVTLGFPEQRRIAKRHLLGDIGRHFFNEGAPPG